MQRVEEVPVKRFRYVFPWPGLSRTAKQMLRLKGIPYVVSIHGGYFTLPTEQADQMSAPFRGKPEWGKVFGFMFGARL